MWSAGPQKTHQKLPEILTTRKTSLLVYRLMSSYSRKLRILQGGRKMRRVPDEAPFMFPSESFANLHSGMRETFPTFETLSGRNPWYRNQESGRWRFERSKSVIHFSELLEHACLQERNIASVDIRGAGMLFRLGTQGYELVALDEVDKCESSMAAMVVGVCSLVQIATTKLDTNTLHQKGAIPRFLLYFKWTSGL